MDLVKEIGIPAMLDQCAEECVELSHACMKLVRIIRGDNPTPASKIDVLSKIHEESADVLLCIHSLEDAGLINMQEVERIMDYKSDRWEERIRNLKEGK